MRAEAHKGAGADSQMLPAESDKCRRQECFGIENSELERDVRPSVRHARPKPGIEEGQGDQRIEEKVAQRRRCRASTIGGESQHSAEPVIKEDAPRPVRCCRLRVRQLKDDRCYTEGAYCRPV